MKVVIVETNEQLQDSFSVRKKVFVEEQQVPLSIEIDEHENHATHFVLYEGRQPVGAGRFRILEGYGKVERICVCKEYRGAGAGNKIMKAVEDYAKELRISLLRLNAQTSAIPFYEKLGYCVVSEVFMDAGIPHRTMEKKIAAKVDAKELVHETQ